MLWIAVVILINSAVASLPPRVLGGDPALSCNQSPAENLLPSVVGPMAGSRPAWFVDGDLFWEHAEHPVKTLWVIARTSAVVRIGGKRVDGPGTVKFRLGQDEPFHADLVIADPSAASAVPGGASPQVMRAYSFIPSHVLYSSPGCWEFTVQVGSDEVRLVREIKPAR